MPSHIDYWGNEKPKCPHCGEDFDVWGEDNPLNLSYEDGGHTTFKCFDCETYFLHSLIRRHILCSWPRKEASWTGRDLHPRGVERNPSPRPLSRPKRRRVANHSPKLVGQKF